MKHLMRLCALLILTLVFTLMGLQPTHAQNTTILHSFSDGTVPGSSRYPEGAPTLSRDGVLYGTTYAGGIAGKGTVYKITPGGKEKIVYSFGTASAPDDGHYPDASLVLGPGGDFYGTTFAGETADLGTVFRITPGGTETVLHVFDPSSGDGEYPYTALASGSDGNLYGTTGREE